MPKNQSITEIDPYHLDAELARQADLYQEWGQALAKAQSDLEDAITEQDLVEAEIAYSMRREPERYALSKSKISETMIKKTIPLQPEYQDAVRVVNKHKRKVGSLKVVIRALEHKKQALEDLVKLTMGSYFAEPKLPRERREEMARREDKKFKIGIDKRKK